VKIEKSWKAEFPRAGILPVFAALITFTLSTGCATPGAHYDPATGLVKKADATYKTGLPQPGWTRLHGKVGDVAFFNENLNATISANAACPSKGDPPLRILLNHLMFDFSDRHVLEETTLMMDGREALRAVYTARLDGVPRKFLVYIIKKNSCVFDMQYQASEASFEFGVQAFEDFVKAFGTEK
jgi:hypothetical protein